MKKIFPLILVLVAIVFASCDMVNEDNRYIYVKPKPIGRAVLIEDFTGQRCPNCPKAHEEIEKLQAQYGANNVIAVAIHSGPLAIFPIRNIIGLRTKLGDEYYKTFGVSVEPTGMVDRRGGILNYPSWAGAVNTELQRTAPVGIKLSISYDNTTRKATVDVDASGVENVAGKLQLWIVEDGIKCRQDMPDGTVKPDYVQNNVLRAAVNGTWGTDISVKEGETVKQSFTTDISEKWNADKVAIVAFIYNDGGGVLQVVRKSII